MFGTRRSRATGVATPVPAAGQLGIPRGFTFYPNYTETYNCSFNDAHASCTSTVRLVAAVFVWSLDVIVSSFSASKKMYVREVDGRVK